MYLPTSIKRRIFNLVDVFRSSYLYTDLTKIDFIEDVNHMIWLERKKDEKFKKT